VVLDVVCAVLEVALALGEVGCDQVLHETLAVRREGAWEADLALEDLGLDFHGLVGVEGVDPVNHFLDQDAQRPPVHRFPVALVHDDLRRDLLGRAAEGLGLRRTDLGEAKVGHLELAVGVDQ